MLAPRDHRRDKGRGIALALAVCLGLGACAVVESPPGGPVDTAPPYLVLTLPDSGAVNVPATSVLEFTFSEKMDRTTAQSWLHLYPQRKFRKTKWHGATRAEVFLDEPIPADTVVVVEITGGMKDAHKVAGKRGRRFPIATGAGIPGGRITGSLVMADTGLAGGVLELYSLPPDTLEYFEQPLLRRTVSGVGGRYAFEWLPADGGPYLIRAFQDPDGNLRLGENEARRLLPDTVSLAIGAAQVDLRPVTLYPLATPGDLAIAPPAFAGRVGPAFAFAVPAADPDTGYAPAPAAYDSTSFVMVGDAVPDTLRGLKAGPVRLVVFADLDPDSSLGVLPADTLAARAETLGWRVFQADIDTLPAYLEPVLILEGLVVEPGLTVSFAWPDSGFALWPGDLPAAPADSLSSAGGDSLAPAPIDTLVGALIDTLTAQPVPAHADTLTVEGGADD